ncbi:MAG: response regulator [bacterium]
MDAAAAKPPAVLLVEDDPVQRGLVQRMLGRLGWTSDVAIDGDQAVAAACKTPYDFVFMDIEMPTCNGWDATRRIHAALGPQSPYIVALTSHNRAADRRACADAGMDDFLVKPVRLTTLANLLGPGTGRHAAA